MYTRTYIQKVNSTYKFKFFTQDSLTSFIEIIKLHHGIPHIGDKFHITQVTSDKDGIYNNDEHTIATYRWNGSTLLKE